MNTQTLVLNENKTMNASGIIKKILVFLLIAGLVASLVWIVYYFINKSSAPTVTYKTESPFMTNIVKKTVATGAIIPRREVQIKPQVSGVIEALYVEAGQPVRAGQVIAKIRIVQNLAGKNNDMRTINSGENQMQTARVNFENAKIEKERQEKRLAQKAISQQEFNRFVLDFNIRKESLEASERELAILKQSVLQNSGRIANEIYATADGIVLDVPVKVGGSVIERNNFNEGTTLATVADMKSLIFEGKIDESEVGKLHEGMELSLTIGALPNKVFKATLEYISPKGKTEEGAVKFEIRAKVLLQPGDYVRAGYSANADIVLDTKDNVMAIKESTLQFGQKDSVYVEVETSKTQVFAKKLIKTGISDGINIEVLSGLTKVDKIKIPDAKQKEKK